MKVYLLIETERYEPDYIVAIYATMDLAEAGEKDREAYNQEMEIPYKRLYVEEMDVITE